MIICCGEALIDMLPRTSTQGEDAFAPYAGGAVFNTAMALGPARAGDQASSPACRVTCSAISCARR
jgi:sugar/nucleoside kinase (ribokinase family)